MTTSRYCQKRSYIQLSACGARQLRFSRSGGAPHSGRPRALEVARTTAYLLVVRMRPDVARPHPRQKLSLASVHFGHTSLVDAEVRRDVVLVITSREPALDLPDRRTVKRRSRPPTSKRHAYYLFGRRDPRLDGGIPRCNRSRVGLPQPRTPELVSRGSPDPRPSGWYPLGLFISEQT